jgi:hypothetical protein
VSPGGQAGPRRILVALDASRDSLLALPVAAALAARAGGVVEALFVEDLDLLRAASLPLARQVALPTGEARPLDPATLHAELRALAARLREAVASAAARRGTAWTFRVARGRRTLEVAGAAREADLLVLGPAPLGSAVEASLAIHLEVARASVPVLALSAGAGVDRPLVVAEEDPAEAERLAAQAGRLLGREPPVAYRRVARRAWAAPARTLAGDGGVVAVSASGAALDEGELAALLRVRGLTVLVLP